MNRRFAVLGSLVVLFLAGCSNEVLMTPEPAPGFEESTRSNPAVIREADNCFIRNIDDNEIANAEDLTFIHTVTYRQYELTPGRHNLTVSYYKRYGSDSGRSKYPHSLSVDVAADRTYAIHSNRTETRTFLFFSHWKWHPSVADATSQQRVDSPAPKAAVVEEGEKHYLPEEVSDTTN